MQKKQKKQEEKKGPQKINTHFWGGPWKRAGSSSTFFQKGVFQNPQKPIFIAFTENGWRPLFFKKAMLQGGRV